MVNSNHCKVNSEISKLEKPKKKLGVMFFVVTREKSFKKCMSHRCVCNLPLGLDDVVVYTDHNIHLSLLSSS